jgi:hypothetical protein
MMVSPPNGMITEQVKVALWNPSNPATWRRRQAARDQDLSTSKDPGQIGCLLLLRRWPK